MQREMVAAANGKFWIATASERDAVLQGQVRQYFRTNPAPFHVEVLFWPDITADISQDGSLVAKHWKGFGGPTIKAQEWPPDPKWCGRESVRAEEVVEYHCEMALWTPGVDDVAASELATEVQAAAQRYVGLAIENALRRTPTREEGLFRWEERNREADNVLRAWQVEIGNRGSLAFRWSKFTTASNYPKPLLEMAPLLDGVIVPLHLHRVAMERNIGRAASSLFARLSVRLACHATPSPLLLRDDIGVTLPSGSFSIPESLPEWTADLDGSWQPTSCGIAVRVLDRALSNFGGSPGQGGVGGAAAFVRIDEQMVRRLYGAF